MEREDAMFNRAILWAVVWSCAATTSVSADAISDWNEKAVAFVTARQVPPPQAERVMAMVHLAMFDAVNSIERRYRPGVTQLPSPATASKEAAAAVAAGTVLIGLYPEAAELKGAMAAYLAAMPGGEAKSAGVRLGEAVAATVLQARAKDGSEAADAYRPKAKAGVYVPTALTVGSTWPNLKPFALTGASQFRPQPPIALDSEQWAADYNEIKSLGGRTSSKRSARQTEDARFWLAPGPVIYYPVVRQIAAARKLNLLDSARFMAQVALARNDAFIAVFDAKYHYDFWRPITAIRNGDIDDNPNTERDAAWQPIDNTPLHPEYPCAHCIMAATMSSVVESLFGTADVLEVTLTSPTAPGVTHSWTNLWVMTDEVSQARIWAGFHYRFSTQVGQDMGRNIGRYVVKNSMQPATIVDAR
jgi:PAP2 superfamily